MAGHAGDVRAGLEAEVRAAGEAWAPWLVYADFLSEQDDARGELIGLAHRRVEALTKREAGDELASELEGQIRELVARHGDDWRGSALPEDWKVSWRCGFIVGLHLPFTDAAVAALGEHLASPQLRLLASLELDYIARDIDEEAEEAEYDDDAWEPDYVPPPRGTARVGSLCALELGGLRRFALRHGSLCAEACEQLAGWSGLVGLRELDLRYNYLDAEASASLWCSPQFSRLEALSLHHNRLDAEACASLCGAPWAASLRRVDLRRNPLSEAGARALAGAPALAGLERLHLEFADVGRAGAQALAASPHLAFSIRRYWKARHGAAARDPSSSS